jgi:hypothetical protein
MENVFLWILIVKMILAYVEWLTTKVAGAYVEVVITIRLYTTMSSQDNRDGTPICGGS